MSEDNIGEAGTLTGKACPQGLYGLYCEVVLSVHMRYCFCPSKHFWFYSKLYFVGLTCVNHLDIF